MLRCLGKGFFLVVIEVFLKSVGMFGYCGLGVMDWRFGEIGKGQQSQGILEEVQRVKGGKVFSLFFLQDLFDGWLSILGS